MHVSDKVQDPQQNDVSVDEKLEWMMPKVSRFCAGNAEAADINNTDGTQTS
jgi:hypothetical protein